MNILKITTDGTNSIPQAVNMRGKIKNTPDIRTTVDEEKSQKDVLIDPMETIGRSQVNFKGIKSLNNNDLNHFATIIAKTNLKPQDVIAFKRALIHTMNQYKCKTFEEVLTKAMTNDESEALNFVVAVVDEAKKINPKLNSNKLSNTVMAIFC